MYNFVKINPCENMTIFIKDKVERESQSDLAKKIMDYSSVHGEQVGFIEKSSKFKDVTRLQMMGGEFCGNSIRALAGYMVLNNFQRKKQGQPPVFNKVEDLGDNTYIVNVESSGSENIVEVLVKIIDFNGKFLSRIRMPLPLKEIEKFKLDIEGKSIDLYKVTFQGIWHFIVDVKDLENLNLEKEKIFQSIKSCINPQDYDAFGIMFYDFEKNFLQPLVYVKNTDSLFWERSCASGTSALAYYLTIAEERSLEFSIREPGGEMIIQSTYEDGKVKSISLDGICEVVCEGVVNV